MISADVSHLEPGNELDDLDDAGDDDSEGKEEQEGEEEDLDEAVAPGWVRRHRKLTTIATWPEGGELRNPARGCKDLAQMDVSCSDVTFLHFLRLFQGLQKLNN